MIKLYRCFRLGYRLFALVLIVRGRRIVYEFRIWICLLPSRQRTNYVQHSIFYFFKYRQDNSFVNLHNLTLLLNSLSLPTNQVPQTV